MKKVQLISGIFLLLVCTSLFGGGRTESTVASPAAQESTDRAGASDVFVPFTVTDMAGREVKIVKPVNSIATFGAVGVLNAFVELMGSGDKILNEMPANFRNSAKWKMQYQFAPQLSKGPILQSDSGELMMEQILLSKPDLCLTMTKDTAQLLADNGLTVIYLEWKVTDDVKKAVTLMGKVLGKEKIAADYLTYFGAMTAEAESITANVPEAKRVKVLYGSVTQFSQPHIIAEWWIKEAGGISVTEKERTGGETFKYTTEDILRWNPDVMIVSDAATIPEIMKNPHYADIGAIKNYRIYEIPTVAHVWGNRTVEQPLTIFWTLNKLYPDKVSNALLAEKIKYFYGHFFKYNMTDEQIDKIIGQ